MYNYITSVSTERSFWYDLINAIVISVIANLIAMAIVASGRYLKIALFNINFSNLSPTEKPRLVFASVAMLIVSTIALVSFRLFSSFYNSLLGLVGSWLVYIIFSSIAIFVLSGFWVAFSKTGVLSDSEQVLTIRQLWVQGIFVKLIFLAFIFMVASISGISLVLVAWSLFLVAVLDISIVWQMTQSGV